MKPRLAKQIIYGTVYLALFFLVIFIVYLLWLKPAPTCFDNKKNQGEKGVDCGGPCISCEIKALSPLEASWIKHFPAGQQLAIVTEIKNPNLNYGADSFSYVIDVYNGGGDKIKSLIKNSFIYSGEIKYIIETAEIDPKDAKEVKISLSDISWKLKEEFPKPEIQLRGIKTEPTTPENIAVKVSGFLTNKNAFQLSKARIIGFLFNQNNFQISASKTELENIKAFEESSFKISFPNNVSLLTNLTQSSIVYNFTRDLTIGSKGEDVKKLQEFLKEQGFFNREASSYFGSVTKEALINFQKKANISPTAGYFGLKTRNYINSLIKSKPAVIQLDINNADSTKTQIYVEAIR